MNTVTIPSTLTEAQAQLEGLGRLINASAWERAAIVAAYVELSVGGRPSANVKRDPNLMTPVQFSELGIFGLRSHNSVRKYAEHWFKLGKGRPARGAEVELPEWEFPFPRPSAVPDKWTAEPKDPIEIAANELQDDLKKNLRISKEQMDDVRKKVDEALATPTMTDAPTLHPVIRHSGVAVVALDALAIYLNRGDDEWNEPTPEQYQELEQRLDRIEELVEAIRALAVGHEIIEPDEVLDPA